MLRPARHILVCLTSFALLPLASGCITVQPPSFSLDSLTGKKSPSAQVAYEEPVEEAPPDPENPNQIKLAYARWMEDMGEFVEAKKHYTHVNNQEPKNVEAILGLARMEQAAGDAAAAEELLKKAIKLNPHAPAAQFALGQFHANQGNWDAATGPYTKAMLANPHEKRYRYHLAVALVRTGDINSALPHFIRTVGDAEAHYNVGLILFQQNRLREAEHHFELAATKKPDLQQAQNWLAHLRGDAGPRADSQSRVTHASGNRQAAIPTAEGHPPIESPRQRQAGMASENVVVPTRHDTDISADSSSSPPAPRPLTPQQAEQLRNQQP